MPVDGAPIRGSKSAPVTLVEYADYECPYCQDVYPTIKKLEKDLGGKLSVVFKDCPLPMHSHAKKAAEAAICASSQGKFWEYHDVLFESAGKLDVSQLKADAKTVGLNAAEFDKCLDSGAEADKVQKALSEAQELGLTGTPSFFPAACSFSGFRPVMTTCAPSCDNRAANHCPIFPAPPIMAIFIRSLSF